MNPFAFIAGLIPSLTDASTAWGDAADRIAAGEPRLTTTERIKGARSYGLIDIREESKDVRYRPSRRRKALGLPGRRKRTAYPPVDLQGRRVVLVVHQTGVVRSLARLAQIAERVAAEMGVPVPGPDYEIGGLTIPSKWRSEAFKSCMVVNA